VKYKLAARFMAMAGGAALLVLAAAPGRGQSKAKLSSATGKPTPRTPDGKPDLSGFWQGPLLRNMFASGRLPLLERRPTKYNMTQSVNPEGLCLFAGMVAAVQRDRAPSRHQFVEKRHAIRSLNNLEWHAADAGARDPRKRSRKMGRRHAGDRLGRIQRQA
jgi:hypothetical protein